MIHKIKKYYFKNLLDKYDDIIKRCDEIEKASIRFDFIPKIQFFIFKSSLIYKQEFVQKYSLRSLEKYKKHQLLNNFSKKLDLLSKTGFVHGDMNCSNIVYDGEKINLIDFEPSFKQIKFDKTIIKSFAISRSLNDVKMNKITSETDKIGFFLLCKDLLGISYLKESIKDIIKKRKYGYDFLPIKEKEFVKYDFFEIFNLVINI